MKKFNILLAIIFYGLSIALGADRQPVTFHLPFLAAEYDSLRYCDVPLPTLKITHVDSMLRDLQREFSSTFSFKEIGRSVENRPVFLARLGQGPVKVLLWSQMHGDEPTATAALMDIFHYLLDKQKTPFARSILDNITILAVPMLNPDGAACFERRNAQGLDVNRDARERQSPGGQLLYQLQQQYQPDFGFNLHDQRGRRTVGNTNKQVAIALMAPPYDATDNDNPVRLRAKKIVAVIYDAMGPYLYGHIAKYDADYMPRAFGDAMQHWGVSTILLESGGWPTNRHDFLQKMNFIALTSALHAIATGAYQAANPAIYDRIPENDKDLYDLIIRDVTLIDGTGIPSFRTDIAINYSFENKQDPHSEKVGRIAELGDLDYFAAKDTLIGSELFITPGLVGVLPEAGLSPPESLDQMRRMLQTGFTTFLLPVNPAQKTQIEALRRALAANRFVGNVGGILYLENELVTQTDSLQILQALQAGFLGLGARDSTRGALQLARWVNKPAGALSTARQKTLFGTLDPDRIHTLSAARTARWQIPQRGRLRIGQIADLVLFSKSPLLKPRVHTVFIKGHAVFRDGEWLSPAVEGEIWLPAE